MIKDGSCFSSSHKDPSFKNHFFLKARVITRGTRVVCTQQHWHQTRWCWQAWWSPRSSSSPRSRELQSWASYQSCPCRWHLCHHNWWTSCSPRIQSWLLSRSRSSRAQQHPALQWSPQCCFQTILSEECLYEASDHVGFLEESFISDAEMICRVTLLASINWKIQCSNFKEKFPSFLIKRERELFYWEQELLQLKFEMKILIILNCSL